MSPNHTRFIVGCITLLSTLAMVLGFYLLLKGFQSGELLVTNGGVAGLSGLVGFLGGQLAGKNAEHTQPPSQPTNPPTS